MSPRPLVLELHDALSRADLNVLFLRTCHELASGRHCVLEVQMENVAADAVAVDAVARLALAASRHGCALRLRGADSSLWPLLELAGLQDLVRSVRRVG